MLAFDDDRTLSVPQVPHSAFRGQGASASISMEKRLAGERVSWPMGFSASIPPFAKMLTSARGPTSHLTARAPLNLPVRELALANCAFTRSRVNTSHHHKLMGTSSQMANSRNIGAKSNPD